MLPFVFPAEMIAHPDIGPALFVFAGFHAFLEGVPSAVGIGLGRLGLAEQFAEVEKVLLAGAPLGEGHALPLGDELLRGHQCGFRGSGKANSRIVAIRKE